MTASKERVPKLTEAQRREWDRLRCGMDADLDSLEKAGLVVSRSRINISGTRVKKADFVDLTDLGRAALKGGDDV